MAGCRRLTSIQTCENPLDMEGGIRQSGLMNTGASLGSSAPLSASLVGSWELISRVDYTVTGEQRVDPALGADPIALLIYDANGHFAAQFMKRDRNWVAESSGVTALLNNSRAQGGYDAYFGTYTTNDDNNTVTQTLTGALSQENVGQTLTRKIKVLGDELTIQLQTVAAGGEPMTRTLTWKRVG